MCRDVNRLYSFRVIAIVSLLLCSLGYAQSKDGLLASAFDSSIRIRSGLSLRLFAGELQVQNPTALSLDVSGRVYVAETHRWRKQIHDNRNVPLMDFAINHGKWLLDDLRCRTNDDREAMLERWSNGGLMKDIAGFEHFSADAEAIRLLVDTDGDGRADQNEFFANDFNSPLSGTAGGIMAWEGGVFFANIPSIWKLSDHDADGRADSDRQLIQRGFGVRTSISGHDLNGFAVGPDRRLYWSVGDRGYNFTTAEGVHYEGVGKGAVFRCELDGRKVERVCDGLRNPKEIAFDDFGNLFTVDNNADLGDAARLYYLMEGGDYGWRMGHQINAGQSEWVFGDGVWTPSVWMEEGLWELPFCGQPAYVVPPVAYITSGPCGFAANPGVVALPKAYDHNFFIVDYRGAAARSGLHGFSLEPEGAGFSIVNPRPVLMGVALTDIEFGYDGKLYMSDYIGGWGMTNKGRVLAMFDEDEAKARRFKALRHLATEDFFELGLGKLRDLLGHADRRIRLRAQFALADHAQGASALAAVADDTKATLLERLHGLWGLENRIRAGENDNVVRIISLLADEEPLVRAQAVRVLGECDGKELPMSRMRALLSDDHAYVRAQAATALGRLKDAGATGFLVSIIESVGDDDPSLRHSATYALQRCMKASDLTSLTGHRSAHVRIAAVVALRGLRSSGISAFLGDEEILVRQEVARAIYDEYILGAFSALADQISDLEVLDDTGLRGYRGRKEISGDEREVRLARQYHRRVLYANWHVGTIGAARALLAYAADDRMPERLRLEALHCLETWGKPHELDRVIGDLRVLPERGAVGIYSDLAPRLGRLIDVAKGKVLAKTVGMATIVGYEVPEKKLYAVMMDPEMESEARANAMDAWLLRSPQTAEYVYGVLLADSDDWMFLKGLEGTITARPELAADVIRLVTYSRHASSHRRQKAVARLEELLPEERDPLVIEAMQRLKDSELPGLIQLEAATVAESISERSSGVKGLLDAWKLQVAADPLGEYVVTRDGGDYARGREIFESHAAAQCTRCHSLYGRGGSAGPDLGGIGKYATVDYIVESIVKPGAEVADGWGVVTVVTTDGQTISGTLTAEDDEGGTMTIKVGEDEVVVNKDQVASQNGPFSAMPPMGLMLNKEQIRDVVAFLRAQKEPLRKKKGH